MSALRKAIEAAIAAVGKVANKDATVQGPGGPRRPLHPKKKKSTKYGYTERDKKAMEDAEVL